MEIENTEPSIQAEEPLTAAAHPGDDDGETRSINAWSLADDDARTEVIPYRQGSWKIPIIAVAVAVMIAVGCVAAYLWGGIKHVDHNLDVNPPSVPNMPTAPPPTAAAPGSQAVTVMDQVKNSRFISLLEERGHPVINRSLTIAGGVAVCTEKQAGVSEPDLVAKVADGHMPFGDDVTQVHTVDRQTALMIVESALEVYCQ